jgi:uncharacterized membrane protein
LKLKINLITIFCALFLFAGFAPSIGAQPASASGAVVHAVLFFSPTCTYCHKVMAEDLPPLVEKYKDQLEIVGIDTSQEVGMNLYQAMLAHLNVPDERVGVPSLVVGEQLLFGAIEIPERLPAIVEEGLKSGGIAWPAIPGLQEVLAAQANVEPAPGQTQSQQTSTGSSSQPLFVQRFNQDPLANTIAVIVLVGMIAVLVSVGINYIKNSESPLFNWSNWTIPVLALIGMGVALYLSYVELSGTRAICGPVGNCNSVQESPYARLFGILPIGVMGVMGYAAILVGWALREYGPESVEDFFSLILWGGTMFGVFFSIYLTFLEPFVIGATCAWCITSAIIITLLLLATTGPAMQAIGTSYAYELDDEEDEAGEPGEA